MRTRGETSSGRDGRAQKQKLAGAMLAVRLLGRSLTRNKFRTTMDQIRTQQNEVKQKQIENFIGDKILKGDGVHCSGV